MSSIVCWILHDNTNCCTRVVFVSFCLCRYHPAHVLYTKSWFARLRHLLRRFHPPADSCFYCCFWNVAPRLKLLHMLRICWWRDLFGRLFVKQVVIRSISCFGSSHDLLISWMLAPNFMLLVSLCRYHANGILYDANVCNPNKLLSLLCLLGCFACFAWLGLLPLLC